MKFKKKPVIIDALQWNNNLSEMVSFMGFTLVNHDGSLEITTKEGVMIGNPGDWIIKGIKGEFYPCKPDIFEASYERVVTQPEMKELKNALNELEEAKQITD